MNQFVIIEKLKEQIANRKVTAAVFYSFSFDVKFFENYILTTFLPHVNFSDNEIQNAILWIKYAHELPPITVYCDFHAKGTSAPNLQYEVKTVDLPTQKSVKACFHPKVSYLLLEDNSLIFLTGSNNLTDTGWCTNKEIVAIEELKNGVHCPRDLKYQLRDFLDKTVHLVPNNGFLTIAETLVREFLKQKLYTPESNLRFYSSQEESFESFVHSIPKKSGEETFQSVEILSPYISCGENLLAKLKKIVAGDIFVHVPFNGINSVDISKNTYDSLKQEGVIWSKFCETEKEKGFRFNHSKIYRFRTNTELITIVGSVNFTDAAWRGRKENGNVETALVYVEPISNYTAWLEENLASDFEFATTDGDETQRDERNDAPDFHFELHWTNKTLQYKNFATNKFTGRILFPTKNFELEVTKSKTISLDDKILEDLAANPIIKVKQYTTQIEYLYYPIQLGIESKPLPFKLQLMDNELIELWKNVSIQNEIKSNITELIEKYISLRTDNEGDLIKDKGISKSTINMMSSHISALIGLEEKIFTIPRKKQDFPKAKELFDYYLFTSNIDTLSGYRTLLHNMYQDKLILPSVYWFLLKLLLKNYYAIPKIRAFYKSLDADGIGLKERVDTVTNSFAGTIKNLEITLSGIS